MKRLDLRITFDQPHRLLSAAGVFEARHDALADAFACNGAGGAVAMIDQGLIDANPRLRQRVIDRFAGDDRLPTLVAAHAVSGGEACKAGLTAVQRIAGQIIDAKIDRHSYVLAVGGGAVLDAVGFAAAMVHRGVRLVRVATTTMAQADSGVGVKNGVNLAGVKNMLGTFAVPWAVINDAALLATLSDRDFRAGFSEAVKVAMIKDARLFERIEHDAERIAARDMAAVRPIIDASARWHMRHIAEGGDPFELGSARPLDMGHWAAHRLETMTDFQLRHGEAVAIGLTIDAMYAGLCSLMPDEDVRRVIGLLRALGFELTPPALSRVDELLTGLDDFAEHLGGPLTLILPAGVGRTVTVNHVDRQRMVEAIDAVRRRVARPAAST